MLLDIIGQLLDIALEAHKAGLGLYPAIHVFDAGRGLDWEWGEVKLRKLEAALKLKAGRTQDALEVAKKVGEFTRLAYVGVLVAEEEGKRETARLLERAAHAAVSLSVSCLDVSQRRAEEAMLRKIAELF